MNFLTWLLFHEFLAEIVSVNALKIGNSFLALDAEKSEKTDFSQGFEPWKVPKGSWIIEKWQDLEAKYNQTQLPRPSFADNNTGDTEKQHQVSSFILILSWSERKARAVVDFIE